MDSAIVGAIIGGAATLLAAVLSWWLAKGGGRFRSVTTKTTFKPDKDDIYFMTFLLHDAYEQEQPISSAELAEHHLGYAPLEVEVKLIELEKHKYIKRTNKLNTGMSRWQISQKGVEYMFKNNHQLDDLVAEQRGDA